MSKKILLADDSITIQKVVELTFSDGDYEVIATNNGTKAIEEIPKVKPDIILSDIIMPEKNGYELCEWVKSHPEYRHIPVILLTGTFEPFDPDRAEKAGCDAVVTKPFESQSLIQKVEELIGAAAAHSEAAEASEPQSAEGPTAFAPPPPPRFDEPAASELTREESPTVPPSPPAFGMGEPPQEGADWREDSPQSTPFPPEEEEPKPHGDVFGDEIPRAEEDEDTSTRLIPKMSMEDIQRMREEEQDEPEEPIESPSMSESEDIPAAPPLGLSEETERSPFDAPSEDSSFEDDATRVIPKMSFEDLQRMQQTDDTPAEPEAAPFGEEQGDESPLGAAPFGSEEASPEPQDQSDLGSGEGEPQPGFDEESQPAFGDEETPAFGGAEPPRAFGQEEPRAGFDAPNESTEEFDDSSTRLIPKMAFEDVQRMQEEASGAETQADEAEPEPPQMSETPGFGTGAPGPSDDAGAVNPFASEVATEEETWSEAEAEEPVEEDVAESVPFTESEPELLPPPPHPPEEPVLQEPEPEATAGSISSEESPAAVSLSDEQVDRIARRVVELLSDKAIRDIAWEVIPETAEMIVRERIRELEEA